MAKINITKHISTFFSKIVAGTLTAALSPLAVFTIGGDIPDFSGKITAITNRTQQSNTNNPNNPDNSDNSATQPPLTAYTQLQINNGTLMLYTPLFATAKTPDTPDITPTFTPPDFDFSQTHAAPVMSQNISHPESHIPNSQNPYSGRINRRTFRPEQAAGGSTYITLPAGGYIRNSTNTVTNARLLREVSEPLSFAPTYYANSGEPQVLIIHSHTTETFADVSETFRTTDPQRNIVAVGARTARVIAAAGFGVIHDGTLHDHPEYNGSYRRSAEIIKSVLAEYPSIKIVLDIHRDAIESGGVPTAAVASINGKQAAQIMLISACDNGNWNVPDYMQNFRFAHRLQSQLENAHPGLTRAMLFQYCNYNQNLAPAALLVEIGSHGNTLEQALYAAELLGGSLARLLAELAGSAE